MRIELLLIAAMVAGCAPERSRAPGEPPDPSAAAELPEPQRDPGGPLPDPPRAPPAQPSLPGLRPLTPAVIEAQIGPGTRCALSDDGPPLMVAANRKAIVDDRGRLVRLELDDSASNDLVEGGRFSGDGVAVEVDPGAVVARRRATIVYDASTTIIRGGRGLGVSHGPRWTCTVQSGG
jgi:hypothetical protein